MKKSNQKSKVLKYRVIRATESDRIKGTKLEVRQKRLDYRRFGIFPIWIITNLILWKPNLKKYPDVINNQNIKEEDWLIMEENFDTYSGKVKIKWVCKSKRLLQKLIKY